MPPVGGGRHAPSRELYPNSSTGLTRLRLEPCSSRRLIARLIAASVAIGFFVGRSDRRRPCAREREREHSKGALVGLISLTLAMVLLGPTVVTVRWRSGSPFPCASRRPRSLRVG